MAKKARLIYSESVPTVNKSRLNELSDDLLVLILSKLTMKEAARTSVLSHRWENLWVYYTGSLSFDHVDATFNTRQLSIERTRFISRVNHVLNLLRGSTADEFRVCFNMDASNSDDIERWIKMAVGKKVSRLELDFYCYHSDAYRLPYNLLRSFGSLTSLRLVFVDPFDDVLAYIISNCPSLAHLSIKRAPSLTYLNATTALKLKHLEIEYCSVLAYIISNCPSLEHISIKRAPLLTYLNATTALKLKHLEIEYCSGLKNVDISNTNIESVKFNGEWGTRSSLEKLHSLREASFRGRWCIRVVDNSFGTLPISKLERLELNMGASVLMGRIRFAKVFPTLLNLKHLEVSLEAGYFQNIFFLTSLICASPRLSSFTLKVQYKEPYRYKHLYELPNCEWRKSEKRVHRCLKVVQFIGWYGYQSDMDLVYYLIEKSVVFEKVIIDPRLCFTGKRSDIHERTENVSRDRAKLLRKHVPPRIEFVIL